MRNHNCRVEAESIGRLIGEGSSSKAAERLEVLDKRAAIYATALICGELGYTAWVQFQAACQARNVESIR